MPSLDCHQGWRMALDPKQASIIVTIGTGICIGLVGYLAYVLYSMLATA
jgi:preprotein translocase subunit Sss1